jgi:cell wall-associated NlpC family hydrolase
MIDYNDYIGIPWVCGKASFDGADCWGLVSMVYMGLFNIQLAHFNVDDIDNPEKTMHKIESVRDRSDQWEKTSTPNEGDVVMMISRKTLRPEHVGVYIGKGKILHSMTRETGQSEIHPVKLMSKIFKRLEYYTYVG